MNKIRWQKYIKIHYDDKNVVYFTTRSTKEKYTKNTRLLNLAY